MYITFKPVQRRVERTRPKIWVEEQTCLKKQFQMYQSLSNIQFLISDKNFKI